MVKHNNSPLNKLKVFGVMLVDNKIYNGKLRYTVSFHWGKFLLKIDVVIFSYFNVEVLYCKNT